MSKKLIGQNKTLTTTEKKIFLAPVSVAIVTRNRSSALTDCLASLLKQTIQPTEYIIIDNHSVDDTPLVIKRFIKEINFLAGSKIVVKNILEKRVGYPVVYNRGLKEARQDWVIFIDDDCVASLNWLESFWIEINELSVQNRNIKSIVALAGCSQTKLPATIWSLAVLAMDQFWKKSVISEKNQILDLETLDNKNVAYFKPFLTQHGLSFNESAMSELGMGAAEDADLGMQIMSAGGLAKYVPDAKIWHQDPSKVIWFLKRLKMGAVANFYYQKRWQKIRVKLSCEKNRRNWRFRDFWKIFCYEQKLTGINSWLVLIIVNLSFQLNKIWRANLA